LVYFKMVMKTRILRRRVIIREYDFKKVKSESLALDLYDRIKFTPLNEDTLEKLKLQEILKGKTGPLTETSWSFERPTLLVYQLRDYLYDGRYYEWNITTDEDGFLCVQSRKNTPKTRLGWGVFEKDVKCRI